MNLKILFRLLSSSFLSQHFYHFITISMLIVCSFVMLNCVKIQSTIRSNDTTPPEIIQNL